MNKTLLIAAFIVAFVIAFVFVNNAILSWG